MSKKIKVSLSSPKSKKKLSLDNPGISLGDGFCKFPFKFKGETYDKCYPGKKGDWCATELDSKKNMKKYAYCDYTDDPATSGGAPAPVKPVKPNTISTKKKKFKKKSKSVLENIPKNLLISNKDIITPKSWILPSRKKFPSWIYNTYKKYTAKKGALEKPTKGFSLDLFTHQKLVRDYIRTDSPYRGLLLFHGLGVGKTCASIAIAECFRVKYNI